MLSADGKQRTLSLKGGGTIVEALEGLDNANHAYTYTILRAPPSRELSLDYQRLSRSEGLGREMGRNIMTPKGATDADAKKVIDGIYEAGEKALVGG